MLACCIQRERPRHRILVARHMNSLVWNKLKVFAVLFTRFVQNSQGNRMDGSAFISDELIYGMREEFIRLEKNNYGKLLWKSNWLKKSFALSVKFGFRPSANRVCYLSGQGHGLKLGLARARCVTVNSGIGHIAPSLMRW